MQFYLIPAGQDGILTVPPALAASQEEGRALAKSRGIKFDAKAMDYKVPTGSKPMLQEMLNQLLADAYRPGIPEGAVEITTMNDPGPRFEPRPGFIDHLDGDPTNNEPSNLREVGRTEFHGASDHRTQERAALKGVSLEVDAITERIGELEGWPLGQCALAAANRLQELWERQVNERGGK